jgi:hypothetical protein
VSIGQTKSQSNYYWRVAAENEWGAGTGSVWQFYAYVWSRLFYTNAAQVWLPARYEGTNVAYDASAVGGSTNWIVESENGGTKPFVENYAFSFTNGGGNQGRIRGPIASPAWVAADGSCSVGFWIKFRSPSSVGGPAASSGMGITGWGYANGNAAGTYLLAYNPTTNSIRLSLVFKIYNATENAYITAEFSPYLSDVNGWNHFQIIQSPVGATNGFYVALAINGQIGQNYLQSNLNGDMVYIQNPTGGFWQKNYQDNNDTFYFITGVDNFNFGKLSDYYQSAFAWNGIKFFDGWMDDIYVYKGRISSSDLLDIYARGRSTDY